MVAWVRVYYYIILSSILNLRSSEIHLFYNLQDFYWHFLEILWLFIFLFLYSLSLLAFFSFGCISNLLLLPTKGHSLLIIEILILAKGRIIKADNIISSQQAIWSWGAYGKLEKCTRGQRTNYYSASMFIPLAFGFNICISWSSYFYWSFGLKPTLQESEA